LQLPNKSSKGSENRGYAVQERKGKPDDQVLLTMRQRADGQSMGARLVLNLILFQEIL